jgi:hypothetical protein
LILGNIRSQELPTCKDNISCISISPINWGLEKNSKCQTEINVPVMRPRWGSNPGLTDRLIVGRNVTLTLGSEDEN